jgi:hypothetical protein
MSRHVYANGRQFGSVSEVTAALYEAMTRRRIASDQREGASV